MREIENNLNNVNFKGIPQMPAVEETSAKADAPVAPVEQKEIQKHPQLVAELNEAMDKYAQNHSEEETLQMFEKMHQEFATK